MATVVVFLWLFFYNLLISKFIYNQSTNYSKVCLYLIPCLCIIIQMSALSVLSLEFPEKRQ